MDEFTRAAMAASDALRALIAAETDGEADRLRREVEEVHLPALGAECPVIAAATQGLLCDILRKRARRDPLRIPSSLPPPPSS